MAKARNRLPLKRQIAGEQGSHGKEVLRPQPGRKTARRMAAAGGTDEGSIWERSRE